MPKGTGLPLPCFQPDTVAASAVPALPGLDVCAVDAKQLAHCVATGACGCTAKATQAASAYPLGKLFGISHTNI